MPALLPDAQPRSVDDELDAVGDALVGLDAFERGLVGGDAHLVQGRGASADVGLDDADAGGTVVGGGAPVDGDVVAGDADIVVGGVDVFEHGEIVAGAGDAKAVEHPIGRCAVADNDAGMAIAGGFDVDAGTARAAAINGEAAEVDGDIVGADIDAIAADVGQRHVPGEVIRARLVDGGGDGRDGDAGFDLVEGLAGGGGFERRFEGAGADDARQEGDAGGGKRPRERPPQAVDQPAYSHETSRSAGADSQ